eukprot:GDKK01061032.1.p1 GENE.GDKK01061032.1~~GDKK01061032.1.p1  ORF type:complete len:155 (+),score=5.86 GDKK01061032.1:63-527(+)
MITHTSSLLPPTAVKGGLLVCPSSTTPNKSKAAARHFKAQSVRRVQFAKHIKEVLVDDNATTESKGTGEVTADLSTIDTNNGMSATAKKPMRERSALSLPSGLFNVRNRRRALLSVGIALAAFALFKLFGVAKAAWFAQAAGRSRRARAPMIRL